MTRVLFALIVLIVPALALAGSSGGDADLIIHHAAIWTVNAAQPTATAVAVIRDRIIAVGSDKAVLRWRGPQTRVIDARGRRLLPGFNDSHVHVFDGGDSLASVQLSDVDDVGTFSKRIADFAATRPPDTWILNGNWDETRWQPNGLPTRQVLDAVSGDHPAALWRYDWHTLLGNSKALALAGITATTPDPPGGVIVRDAKGEPTGALKDAATALLERVIPPPSADRRREALDRTLNEARSHGVTSIQALLLDYETIAVIADRLSKGTLTLRIYAIPPISTIGDQVRLGLGHAFGGPYLRIGALKAFADGSLGSHTAFFFDDYTDQPGTHGVLAGDFQPASKIRDWMMRADDAGIQLFTHAIGDAGISTTLDLYQELIVAHGSRDRRLRIEHAQHMAAKDFDRFATLGVIASVQPYFALDDGRIADQRIGRDRSSRSYAYRTFLDHGVRLAISTDWPTAPLDPMQTLYAATTRATLDGRHPDGWYPEQKLTIQEAIEAYTLGSAYAEFQEHDKGSIEPGKLADLVLLDADPLTIPASKLKNVHVLNTWVGGTLVYGAAQK